MSRGRIEKALSGFYYVNTGAETLQCRARGKFRREGMSPLVGDWVQVRDLGGGEGFVETVEPRRNVFSRPAAANIDQLVILASAAIPVTEPYLIDRISAIAALKGCQVLLCLNKCDLNTADELYDIYSHSALPVLRISAETGRRHPDLIRQRRHRPRHRGTAWPAGRKDLGLYRQLRRGEVQRAESAAAGIAPAGGRGQ